MSRLKLELRARIASIALLFVSGVANAALETRWDIFASVSGQEWNRNSPANSGNQILRVPSLLSVLELRPDVAVKGKDHELVYRSRHFLRYEYVSYFPNDLNEVSEAAVRGESDLSDLYWTATWHDRFSTTLGLQNYQWGPAEIFSPSNPYFHFNSDQRSFFYKEKGLVLARANWNPNSKWAVAVLTEVAENRARSWQDESVFQPRPALKIERQLTNPADSVGVVISQSTSGLLFIGETATFSPSDAISLYIDARHSADNEAYRPNPVSSNTYRLERGDDLDWKSLSIFGVRWEGKVDFRQEFIWNGFGYTDSEWENVLSSVTTLSPYLKKNLERFYRPGLEFRRQSYAYTSIRMTDFGDQDTAISLRWLVSLVEDSSLVQFGFERNLNDRTVFSSEAVIAAGSERGEFRQILDAQASAGIRMTF